MVLYKEVININEYHIKIGTKIWGDSPFDAADTVMKKVKGLDVIELLVTEEGE